MECEIALTEEVVERANKWWGSEGAPICAYSEEPTCYEEKQK